MNPPGLETYANGHNATAVTLNTPNGDTLKLWYSYSTCVAFTYNGARTVSENLWSNTTGRHLAAIDGGDKAAKKERVDGDTFAAKLADAIERFGNASTTDTTREASRSRVKMLEGALSRLLAWEQEQGGWEAPCWEYARHILAKGEVQS